MCGVGQTENAVSSMIHDGQCAIGERVYVYVYIGERCFIGGGSSSDTVLYLLCNGVIILLFPSFVFGHDAIETTILGAYARVLSQTHIADQTDH